MNRRRCDLFDKRINDCGFIEVDSYGPKFMWKGPMVGDNDRVFERHDRGL